VRQARDDLGALVTLPDSVGRVVSLVPSLTEAVARTRRSALVGATQWCTHPGDLGVERVRGTKNPDVRRIVELRPDLVLANQEENRRVDVERLRAAGIAVWVTVTESVPGALTALARLFIDALGWAEPSWLADCRSAWLAAPPPPTRRAVAIAVWRDPWIVVGRDTFAGDLAARLGLANVFAGHADRYPHTDVATIERAEPELILLPSEPYPFTDRDGPEAFTVPTALVDGRALTWYGPSLLAARDDILAAVGRRAESR
jgi:ABC-type Fe3+-hydroxamate transport system substrate-binding protein